MPGCSEWDSRPRPARPDRARRTLAAARQQARSGITPLHRAAELDRLLQTPQHDRVARLEIHGPASDQVGILAGKEIVDGGNAVGQAHDVGVDPPAALFDQELVPEVVGECRWRSFSEAFRLIDEDLVPADELGGVADPHTGRHSQRPIVAVEVDGVSAVDEGLQAKLLVRRERAAVPE